METLKELLAIGKQYCDNKQYAQAESYLKRVLEKSGRYADVLNMLGVISHVEGKFASSIDFFEQALSINPRYTEAMLNLAVLYNDLGQYAEAKKLYGKLKGAKGEGRGRGGNYSSPTRRFRAIRRRHRHFFAPRLRATIPHKRVN